MSRTILLGLSAFASMMAAGTATYGLRLQVMGWLAAALVLYVSSYVGRLR